MRITEYSYDGVNWQRISDEVGSLRAFIMANPRATIRSRDVPDGHSPATYVEGREAPRLDAQEPDVGPWYDDNDHGGAARRIARDCIHGAEVAEVVDPGHGLRPWWRLSQTHEHGEAATWDAAIEACCAALARTRSVQQPAAAKAPDVEACARAAYEESLSAPKRGYHGQALMELEWGSLGPIRQAHWRAIARAVLAAAGRGSR